jgi:hypothetical protein
MIRLPTSDEEEARIGETFAGDDEITEDLANQTRFRDEDDDDIPPPVQKQTKQKVNMNEEDFFDVSDGEDEEGLRNERTTVPDEGTKAWRRE